MKKTHKKKIKYTVMIVILAFVLIGSIIINTLFPESVQINQSSESKGFLKFIFIFLSRLLVPPLILVITLPSFIKSEVLKEILNEDNSGKNRKTTDIQKRKILNKFIPSNELSNKQGIILIIIYILYYVSALVIYEFFNNIFERYISILNNLITGIGCLIFFINSISTKFFRIDMEDKWGSDYFTPKNDN